MYLAQKEIICFKIYTYGFKGEDYVKSPKGKIQKLEVQKTAYLKETEVATYEDDDQYSCVDILEGSYLEMKRSNTDTFALRCNARGFSTFVTMLKKFSTSGKKYIWLDDLSAGDYYVDETEYLFDESDVKIDILLVEGVGFAECSLAHSTLDEANDNRDLLSIRLSKDRLDDMIKLINSVIKDRCTTDYYLHTNSRNVITLQFVLTSKDAVRSK